MKIRYIICLLLVVALGLTIVVPLPGVQANTQDELNKAQQESARLKRELEAAKSKKNTLSGEVARLNNQARLNELEIQDTQGQIQSTQSQITQTNGQIEDVNQKLANLEQVMDQTQTAANARLRQSYKNSRTSNLVSVLTAEDFQAMMRNLEYLKKAKEEDDRILGEMVVAKQNYESQKANLENLKKEKESLQAKLQQQQGQVQAKQSELLNTKNEQSTLLSLTQNDESRYAQLLAENEARISSMRAILQGGVASGQYLGHYQKGELIGYEGNTGCVTGPHLHFSYIVNGGFQNPRNYLGKSIGYPHSNYFAAMTQDYASYHNGIDTSRGVGQPLYATAEGDAYFHVPYTKQQILSSGWCPAYAKPYVKTSQYEIWLKHPNGHISLYAHVSGPAPK